MISFDEAVALVKSAAAPMGKESVGLDEAAGRVLAAPVFARIDSPRSDVSAMDGYAVRDEDLRRVPAELLVAGESFAGRGWAAELSPAQCVRIFTGAPVPCGADRVVIQEEVSRDGDIAVFDKATGDARHIRRRGGDFMSGTQLLPAGHFLDARGIVCAAAADIASLEVYKAPRVQILSTGDELAEPGSARESEDAIPESVSFGVASLAREWGGEVLGRTRLRDDLESLELNASDATREADLVIVTGGASVGEKDFAKTMFKPVGLDLIFSKVSIKPGKPVWLGRAGGALVIGLPGNPTSALVTARLFLAPLLAGMCGRNPYAALRWRRLPLASALRECGPRETFHRAKAVDERAEILSNQDSSAQHALAQADLLVRHRAGAQAIASGDLVEVLEF